MAHKVAVEDDLGIIAQDLAEHGYQVVNLTEDQLPKVEAVIISGEDHNVMDRADTKTDVPVLNARGKTTEEIESALQERIN